MRIEPLIPDAAPERSSPSPHESAFSKTLDELGTLLQGADSAETAFATGSGDLLHAVYERARADVALSVATAAVQRGAQALQSVTSMQI